MVDLIACIVAGFQTRPEIHLSSLMDSSMGWPGGTWLPCRPDDSPYLQTLKNLVQHEPAYVQGVGERMVDLLSLQMIFEPATGNARRGQFSTVSSASGYRMTHRGTTRDAVYLSLGYEVLRMALGIGGRYPNQRIAAPRVLDEIREALARDVEQLRDGVVPSHRHAMAY